MARRKTEASLEADKENLKTIQSVDETRKKGRNGGIKSGEIRRAKKS